MRIYKKTIILGFGAFAFVAIATPVFAVATSSAHAQPQNQTTEQQTTAVDKTAQAKQVAEQKESNPKDASQTRLADTKLKACKNREKAITNIMSRLSDRGQKQLDLFSSIATKTEMFYAEKGKVVASYDTLVADLATKKAVAQAAIDTIKSNSTTFKCDGTDPKGMVSSFKDSLKAETAAINDYKTAVKNLIVAVKSVQAVTASDNKTTGGTQ